MAATTHSVTLPASKSCSISSNNRACAKAESANIDSFPAGLRVLVVDDDPICLLILDRMLRLCQYQVTTCGRATDALAMLRENSESFDVIISDVYMPDMDGFKLLELVGLEMDLPVIMMSANGETSAVMKGIKHGACDYLLKPVRMEELRNIWQHVVRKKWRSTGQTSSHEDDKTMQVADDGDYNSSANEGLDGTWKQSKKRKDIKEEEEDVDLDNDDPSTSKKPRVVWSVDLHQQFVNAVNQLGIDKAVPKRILELMNVHGLTRENVASHLQKYRLYLKRISGLAHQSSGLNPSFPLANDSNFGPVSAAGLAGLGELRTLTGPSQLSPRALVSTLQAGLLGRLGPANNLRIGNVDPSLLFQMAALQGTSNGAPSSLQSYSQPLLSNQGSFQAGPSDVNQLQVSQLGAFAGSLDKGPPTLSALQQQQLVAAASLAGMGQLAGVSNNLQEVNPNANTLFMQALQQQQVCGHLKSQGGLTMPTGGIVGQQGLSRDTGAWMASISNVNGIAGQNSGSLRPGSVPSLVGACSASNLLGPLGRRTDAESKGLQIPNAGNVAVVNSMTVSSPLASSGLDDLSVARMKDMDSSLPPLNEGLPQSFGSKFALFSGLKQGQGLHTGQRTQGSWQGFGLSQEYGQVSNSTIRSPSYSQVSSGGQNLNLGVGQEQGQLRTPGFGTGFSSNLSMDNGHVKASQSEHLRAESSLKVKEEGYGWLPEPLSDELLSILLKQQQEGFGLTESESESGGADCYAMDNMYVK